MKINIPSTVPTFHKGEYIDNWRLATRKSGRLSLFAGDQKIEHLNADFCGPKIHSDDGDPEHLFRIASQATIGVFAAQLGLIAAYGASYKKVPYLIKLNSKTDLIDVAQDDPLSLPLTSVEQVVEFKKHSKLKIVGIGFTIYPGSKYEAQMLAAAANAITTAHQHGLLTVLWIYPRGAAVANEKDAHLIAGCAGLGASLGADFVKVNYPKPVTKSKLTEIFRAAGRTGVVFSGGSSTDAKEFLKSLSEQIAAGASGNATGRNVHQYGLNEAVRMATAITAISVYDYSADDAYQIFLGKQDLKLKLF